MPLLDPLTYNSRIMQQGLLAKNKPPMQMKPVTTQGLLDNAALATSAFPVLGDVVGLGADAHRFVNEPESRTPLNFGLAALGLIPFLPPLVSAGLGKFAQSQGKTLGPLPTGPGRNQAGAIVYHGSPHKFDAFDSSKIGTGEGAQAYGHGLYFAESPDVAAGYRDKLSTNVKVDGSQLTSFPMDGPLAQAHNTVVTSIQNGMNPEEAISNAIKYWDDAAASMESFKKSNPQLAEKIDQQIASRKAIAQEAAKLRPESFYKEPGSLYKVDLPDEAIAKMLDWDSSLAEQPQALSAINKYIDEIKSAGLEREAKDIIDAAQLTGMPARYFYQIAQKSFGADALSKDLARNGIPGIKYLDGGSRNAGQGTRNFVTFPGNEGLLKILERQ